MALSKLELVQLIEDTSKHDPFQNWRQRDDQMHYRSLYVKHDPQLAALLPMYKAKLEWAAEYYDSMRQGFRDVPKDELAEALGMVEAKIRRMAEKLRDTNLEIRGRALDNLKRNPIGTEYFIDLDSGDNGNTGLSTAQAWLTIEQYTTTTVRSPGDIAWVRAGTSEIPSGDINHDESGGADFIYIIGCNSESGTDPWGDAIDTLPIIDINNGAYTWYVNGDHAWRFERLQIQGSSDAAYDSGNLAVASSCGFEAHSCMFRERRNAGSGGVRVRQARPRFYDCDFEGNLGMGLHIDAGAYSWVYRCRFNGAAETQDYGLGLVNGVGVYAEECEFGQDSSHDVGDLNGTGGPMVFRRCVFDKFDPGPAWLSYQVLAFFEDCTGTPAVSGVQSGRDFQVLKSSTVPAGVGYSLNAKWLRNTFSPTDGYKEWVGLAAASPGHEGPLRLWLAAGTYTVKVKIRADQAWGTYPTAAELFLKASFYGAESGNPIEEVVSDEVLSDGSTWVDFQVDFTTGVEGPVYMDVLQRRFESGPKGIYVFPFPEVT